MNIMQAIRTSNAIIESLWSDNEYINNEQIVLAFLRTHLSNFTDSEQT